MCLRCFFCMRHVLATQSQMKPERTSLESAETCQRRVGHVLLGRTRQHNGSEDDSEKHGSERNSFEDRGPETGLRVSFTERMQCAGGDALLRKSQHGPYCSLRNHVH